MNRTDDDTNDIRLLHSNEEDTGVAPGGVPIGGEENAEEEPPEDGEKESGSGDVAPSWRVVALSSLRGEPVNVIPKHNPEERSSHETSDDDGVMDV